MRALLDTNILIHREASVVINKDIGLLFNWLDRLGYQKYVHPISIEEINLHENERVRNSILAKIESYRILQVQANMHPFIQRLSAEQDRSENDRRDSILLNELVCDRVDLIITEDKGIYQKAKQLGISEKIFTIDGFLGKALSENPEFVDYHVLAVEKTIFGKINLHDPFFDSFREDYPDFDRWFNRKSEETCYVCRSEDSIVAFLYLKLEDEREPYNNIEPPFQPKRRLKIGTFKVVLYGFRLGERFLKIIFDNALVQRVDEIYVTVFQKTIDQERLIKLLEDFGFHQHGQKRNPFGTELVYIRNMSRQFLAENPRLTFPYFSRLSPVYLVAIYPEYHTELLPDSILRTESPDDFVEQEPHRNAIRKIYISRSYFRDLHRGDNIIFYRTGGYHLSVVTTLGIVENVYVNIPDEETFVRLCRKRSVFSNQKLREQWNLKPKNRPFIVEFLYAYSFPRRPNMEALINNGVIANVQSAPRGFERITREQFNTIIRLAEVNPRIIVD